MPPHHGGYTGQTGFEWDAAAVIKTLIFVLITFGTIFGNLMVLLAVGLRKKGLKSSTHYLIANLAFADFFVGIFVMPFLATYNVTGKWYFGQGYCTAWACIHFWLCSASILSITAICLDRFIGVQFPLHHYRLMNTRRVIIVSASVWTLALLLSTIPLFVWPEPPSDDPQVCKINHQLGHVIVVSVFIFYIPLAAMVLFYWKIYRIAMNHLNGILEGYKKCQDSSDQMRVHIGSSHSTGYSTNSTSVSTESQVDDISSSSTSGRKPDVIISEVSPRGHSIIEPEKDLAYINFQRQNQTAKKVSIIVGAFILSYFPFFTVFLIKSLNQSAISVEVFIILGWIRYFNSCLNPIIYAVMLKPFRKAFTEMYATVLNKARLK